VTTTDEEVEGKNWLLFCGILLIVMGIARILDSIWAFRYKGSVPDHLQDSLFGQTLSTYGWVWLVMGILLLLSGFGVMTRNQYARWFGILVASLAAVSAFAWMPYYPVWSLVYVGVGIVVVWALSTYGAREVEY
jgi:hypothetical protein